MTRSPSPLFATGICFSVGPFDVSKWIDPVKAWSVTPVRKPVPSSIFLPLRLSWFLFSLGVSSALIDFKIEVNELTSFAFLSAPDCVASNALKYCLASATSFSAFWIWEACFLFPRIRSIWASKSANFACKRDKLTDGFVSVASAVLVCSETAEACSFSFTGFAGSADFSGSSVDFGCSTNSDFASETVSAWIFPWAWFSPVSASFCTTASVVPVAEAASTVSTLWPNKNPAPIKTLAAPTFNFLIEYFSYLFPQK